MYKFAKLVTKTSSKVQRSKIYIKVIFNVSIKKSDKKLLIKSFGILIPIKLRVLFYFIKIKKQWDASGYLR